MGWDDDVATRMNGECDGAHGIVAGGCDTGTGMGIASHEGVGGGDEDEGEYADGGVLES